MGRFLAVIALAVPMMPLAHAGGGPLGIDHTITYDNSGIWTRSNQLSLQDGVIATELVGALWLGGESPVGRTFWQSIDASVFSGASVQVLKYAFSRARPSQGQNPDAWFQGSCCQSFPSGEVALQASFVSPFIVDYRTEHPWVWALELLPAYDSAARLKTQDHWQTDVLAGWAIGSAFGYYAATRESPFFLSIVPHGFMVGLHASF